jgi:YVTN family beta-propeller protein
MRTIVLTILCLTAAASGQWLETTIDVASGPRGLCYNPAENKVYCASEDSNRVSVIDGATNQVVATVQVGYHPWALCYNPAENKVYCANYGDDLDQYHDSTVTVIDGAADTVIATVKVGHGPLAFCYNDSMNKVYVFCVHSWSADDGLGTVSVIDGISDSVVATLEVGGTVPLWCGLCYNRRDNKIYSAFEPGGTALTVIDGTADTVIATMRMGGGVHAFCYNPTGNKVYCACAGDSTVLVVDGAADSVVATLQVEEWPWDFCYNPQNSKVYCAHGYDCFPQSTVSVIDGASDSVIATVQVGRPSWRTLCYNHLNNKVYSTNDTSVSVIDGASNLVLITIPVGRQPMALCHNPDPNRVYVANYRSSSISVIRDSMPSGIAEGERTSVDARMPTVLYGPDVLRMDCSVLDALGRDVTDRKPALAPGIYFLRLADGGTRSAIRKVIVTK